MSMFVSRRIVLILTIITAYMLICRAPSLSAGIEGESPALVLSNNYVRLEFEKDFLGLSGLIDLSSGINHIHTGRDRHLLWELELRRGMQTKRLSSIRQPVTGYFVRTLKDGTKHATIVWDDIAFWREKQVITVIVTVDLPPESGIALWKISVDNRSDFWGLSEVRFPYFSGFIRARGYTVARPGSGWGQLYEDADFVEQARYPGPQWPVQLMAAYAQNDGIFLAAFDPESWLKSYWFEPGKAFYFITYPRSAAVSGSDFSQNWHYAAGVYQGQWLEACKIYREWALKSAPWMKYGKLSRRSGVPQNIKDIGLWLKAEWEFDGAKETPERMNKSILDAQEYLDVPLALHLDNWHRITPDNQYPHYFPPKPGFKERVKNLENNGILVVPHYNCGLWDYNLQDFPLKWALKDFLGFAYLKMCGVSSARCAPICPYTEFMQNTAAGIADSLTGLYGAGGVFLKQGVSTPLECFDPCHGHPVGGGTFQVEGGRKVFQKVKEVCAKDRRDAAVMLNHFSEPYIDVIDGFHISANRSENEVPMNAAIYSGFAIFCSGSARLDISNRSFVMMQGRDFLWGTQNGGISFDLFKPENAKKADYMKKIGQYRKLTRKFLTYGELVTLIEPSNKVPTVTECWQSQEGIPNNAALPSIMAALWRSENGSLAIFLVNFLERENVFEYAIDPVDYGLAKGKDHRYQFAHLKPEGSTLDFGYKEHPVSRKEVLCPWEIKVLEVYTVNY